MKIKILILILTLFGGLFHNYEVYASGEKDYIDLKIEENKRIRNEKIRLMIEQKIYNFEEKESFKNLELESKIKFYETLIDRINIHKKEVINNNKKEVYNIFFDIANKRLEFYNISDIEGEEIFLELLENQ